MCRMSLRITIGHHILLRMIENALTTYFDAGIHSGIVAAWLFGSFAENRAHRESDVDVGVLVDRGVYGSAESRSKLRLELTVDLMDATGQERVDVIILNDAPPELARHIVVNGRRLFAPDAEAARAFERDAQLRAADIAPWLARMRRIKLDALRK
jgi:predicted nucleotidyltransferase